MSNMYVENNIYQGTSQACIADITPPVFAGIDSLFVVTGGPIRATWLAATDSTPPIRYEVYIKESTSTDLFNVANIVTITDKLQADIFSLPTGSFLNSGVTYYVGVRALDGVSNRETNLVSLSVVYTGLVLGTDEYQSWGEFSIDDSYMLRGMLWATKNGEITTTLLGTASYKIYDKTGTAIGIAESGLTPNADGNYVITPVLATSMLDMAHFTIEINITIASAQRKSRRGYRLGYDINLYYAVDLVKKKVDLLTALQG